MCDNFCGWLSPKESTLKTTIGIYDDIPQIERHEIIETFLVYIDVRTVEFDDSRSAKISSKLYIKRKYTEKCLKKELAVFLERRLWRLAEFF